VTFLDTKKSFEKAFTLFSGYLTVSLALFGIAVALFKDQTKQHLALPFLIAGILFVLGAICFVLALKGREYGALASAPDMWLNGGTIDGADSVVPLMLAYITFYHHERIEKSETANRHKANLVSCGIYIGIAAPFIMLAAFFVPEPWLQALFN
jgi:hypothetical protein